MIRLLRSAAQDLDSLAHVEAIRAAADVREDRPVAGDWSLIARAAATLWTRRDDLLVTVGDAALAAASLAPRRRLIHVPVGTPTPRERSLLSTRLSDARLAVATRTARTALVGAGIEPRRIALCRVAPSRPHVERDVARRTLGVDDATVVVHVPGRIRADSGHRVALYACAILAYAEPSWRHFASARGDVAHAERFIASTAPPGAIRIDSAIDDATLSAAADVAVFCATGAPELVAIDAALARGTPIVAPAALWRRERLPIDAHIVLYEGRKSRAVARAMLDAVEANIARHASQVGDADRVDWASLFDDALVAS